MWAAGFSFVDYHGGFLFDFEDTKVEFFGSGCTFVEKFCYFTNNW